MESLAGTTIGGYSLVQSIGNGPTGEVLVAEKESENPYAIKVLHKKLSLFTKVESYWEDIQEAAKLSNPYTTIPTIGDWSKAGRFFMVMPLLKGMDLAALLQQQGNLPARQVLLLMGQVCLALESAHDAGLAHGAVKPRNIFLVPKDKTSRFSTRLLDFASNSLLDTEKIPAAAIGEAGVPDPSYLAPEQFEGNTSASSDVYAMGVVLYETLLGQKPYPGNYEEIAQQQISIDPELPAVMPDELANIVLKAMAKSPASRYGSIAELREALEAWASSSPSELDEEAVAIFSEDDVEESAAGPATSDQTVRVAVDDIDNLFDEDEPEEEVLVMPPPKKAEEPAAEEPAAEEPTAEEPTAEEPKAEEPKAEEPKAKTPKAEEPKARTPKTPKTRKPKTRPPSKLPMAAKSQGAALESYRDGDNDVVDLPMERSVKAFVADLGPLAVPEQSGSNGESLDAALDAFIQQAHAWSAALPPAIVEGESLELLAQPPQPEPEPAPQVAPAPALTAPEIPSAFAQPEPVKQRSVLGPVIIALLFGAGLSFGAFKLFLQPPPRPAAVTEIGSEPTDTPPAAEPPARTAEPAPAEPGEEPGKEPGDEPPRDETKTAGDEPKAEPGDENKAAGAEPKTEPLDTPPGDEAKTAATPPGDEAKTPPGDEAKAPPAAEPKTPPEPKAKAVVAVKAPPKARKKRRRRRKARPAVARKKTTRKKTVKKKPPKKKKKKKSDWVDPFSQ